MRTPTRLLAALAVAMLALAPMLADARPGGGMSSGSRGSRTYSAPPSTNTAPGTAQPMQRTQQPPPSAAQPEARPGMGQAAPQQRPSFMRGLMGGLLGAGLIGLLLGGGLLGGFSGFASVLGFLVQIALIGGLVWLLVAFVRRRSQPAPAGLPQGMAREAMDGNGGSLGGGGGAGSTPVQLEQADFAAFERLLQQVNGAWSAQDMATLQRLATPEMAGYFAGDLRDLEARGWVNQTRDVKLEQGDLSEAWREGARDYATVAMRFSLVDVTRRKSDGAVMEGDPERRTQATELWTFVRPSGGSWMLSAIQQSR